MSSKGNKWKGHYDKTQKFKPEWQKKHPCVKKADDGSEIAYTASVAIYRAKYEFE